MIQRVLEYRAAILTLGLVAAAVGVAQVADRFAASVLMPREPAVFTVTPQGEDVARLAPITVTFANAPAERQPEKLVQVEPAPTGTYAWLSPRTLLFQPDFPGLLRGSTYSVHVPARPDAGLPEAVTKKFTVTGQLTVQQTIPGNGDWRRSPRSARSRRTPYSASIHRSRERASGSTPRSTASSRPTSRRQRHIACGSRRA